MLHVAAAGAHQRLWFELDRWNLELHRICGQVRAAEDLRRRRLADGGEFSALEERLAATPDGVDSLLMTGPDGELIEVDATVVRGPASVAGIVGADVVAAREELRRLLGWLKSRLLDELTEREAYHCLFPLVIYTDELLNDATAGGARRWEPLQSELYDVDNGGELFFSSVETLLGKDDTHPLVFELYYFCLLDGFVGQYDSQPGKLAEYRRRIAERIPVEAVLADDAAGPAQPVTLVRFPVRACALSAAACLLVFLALSYWARLDIGEPRASGSGALEEPS